VDSTTVEHRLAAEGADFLLLGGVNDSNLQELAKLSGCRVILRGDDLILSGDVNDVERALPVAEHMVQQARIGQPFDADEIRRSFASETQRPRTGVRRVLAAGCACAALRATTCAAQIRGHPACEPSNPGRAPVAQQVAL
jgi:phosphate starvation-inducible PhoH-like protein